MTLPISPPKSAGVLAAVFTAALLVAPPASHAQSGLLNLDQTTPQIQFDLSGRTVYDGAALSVDAQPLVALFDFFFGPVLPAAGGPRPGVRAFVIRVQVDSAGNLVGGNPAGPDLEIVGNIPGIAGADGILLTGEVRPNGATNCLPAPAGVCRGFGFAVGPSGTEFEFRFQVTDGALKGSYGNDVVVRVTSVNLAINGFGASFNGRAEGIASQVALPVGEMFPPPALTVTDAILEATGPLTPVTFNVRATDANGPVPVICNPASGSSFPLGTAEVSCSATNIGGTSTKSLHVTVQDTTPPVILGGSRVDVEATTAAGATVVLPWTAKDLASGDEVLPVTCDNVPPASFFPLGTTHLLCHADDGRGNRVSETFPVTVTIQPPKFPGGSCFVVDFREITYFRKQTVLTSSDAAIREAAGLAGDFNPAVWPYLPGGGAGSTKSKGTLFRLYGFQPSELGQLIPDADESFTSYPVQYDDKAEGHYIDLGGPARVFVCPQQIHDYVLAGGKGNGHVDSSTLLPPSQRNVPGIMLTHNSQILKLPRRIKQEMAALGLEHGGRGLIDYIGVQLQGNGSAEFREFVDLEISFPGDSEKDRLEHFKAGLHTATNVSFESFAGCNYVDYAPGNDAVRLRDIWGPNRSRRQGYENWRACGTREPSVNRKVRANYEVPFNAIQLLPTVNTASDTLRIFFGEIRPVVATKRQRLEHKTDWREWDLSDF